MMHPETVEVYDRKATGIGLVERERTLSCRERSLKQWNQGGSFSRKRTCVLTVATRHPEENTVAAVVFTNARASTTLVSVTDLEETRQKRHKVVTQC